MKVIHLLMSESKKPTKLSNRSARKVPPKTMNRSNLSNLSEFPHRSSKQKNRWILSTLVLAILVFAFGTSINVGYTQYNNIQNTAKAQDAPISNPGGFVIPGNGSNSNGNNTGNNTGNNNNESGSGSTNGNTGGNTNTGNNGSTNTNNGNSSSGAPQVNAPSNPIPNTEIIEVSNGSETVTTTPTPTPSTPTATPTPTPATPTTTTNEKALTVAQSNQNIQTPRSGGMAVATAFFAILALISWYYYYKTYGDTKNVLKTVETKISHKV